VIWTHNDSEIPYSEIDDIVVPTLGESPFALVKELA
jgi:hypothetical protein